MRETEEIQLEATNVLRAEHRLLMSFAQVSCSGNMSWILIHDTLLFEGGDGCLLQAGHSCEMSPERAWRWGRRSLVMEKQIGVTQFDPKSAGGKTSKFVFFIFMQPDISQKQP